MRSIFGAAILFMTGLMTGLGPVQAGEEFPEIKQALKTIFSSETADSIVASPIPGLYEIVVGGDVIYGTKDGKYMMQGNLYNVSAKENLTENRRGVIRAKVLGELNDKDLIVFAPEKIKHTITVFTDVDCGYCRKLHSEIDAYNAKGIAIRYAAYPRSGIGQESYKKIVNVWCADDRKAAMTKAKSGVKLPELTCDNPVAKQYSLGGRLGIQGTPAIFLSDGTMLPGYIPPDRLAGMLEMESATK